MNAFLAKDNFEQLPNDYLRSAGSSSTERKGKLRKGVFLII